MSHNLTIISVSIVLFQNSVGRPDDVVAAETLANHIRCNNSFVYALFQAQFRSSLTCPQCRCQSNTFDPFLCVSVPVPQNQRRPVYVTVLYTSQQPRQVGLSSQKLGSGRVKKGHRYLWYLNPGPQCENGFWHRFFP